ncbi:MAG: pyridoxamine 5'-phosphate oxidase family protein [Mycobacterium sp.]|nr:pyridoxamine 5'-phosphate oxidase family protein [Mycobacterium sp.]
MTKENVEKLGDVLRTLDCVMLATQDQRGHLVSRPMALHVDTFDGSISLFAPVNSRVVANIKYNPRVNISYTGPMTSLSVAGTAALNLNHDRVAAGWHRDFDPWLPDGPDAAVLIAITVDEARFWTFTGRSRSPVRIHNGIRQIDVADLV